MFRCSRDVLYIKAHQAQYVVIDDDGNVHIKNSLEQCGDAEVVRQIQCICKYDVSMLQGCPIIVHFRVPSYPKHIWMTLLVINCTAHDIIQSFTFQPLNQNDRIPSELGIVSGWVTQEFDKYMKPEDKDKIKSAFSVHAPIIDNDINISLDQTCRLRAAIAADSTFSYPLPETDGSFSVDKAFDFLVRLGDIFDWKRYEYSTLGKCDTAGNYTKLRWYSVILIQWLEGKGI